MFSLKVRGVFLVSALVLLLMLAHAPRACFAQEAGTNDDRALAVDRALGVLRNVVGLNVDAYNWSIRAYGKGLFWDVLPKEFVGFDFWAKGSQLRAYVDFVNGKLQMISVYVEKGLPLMLYTAANEVEMAKDFLSRYQAYCGATHVEEFKAVLDTIEPKTNTVKVYGNVKFEAEYTKPVDVYNRTLDVATFRWKYRFNGIEAFYKCVMLAFENGYFRCFSDNWNLFKIGSYDINIDEKKAIEIAINAVKNYSYRVYWGYDTWETVSGFKVVGAKAVALMFSNSLWKWEARDGDPLTLYPMWIIDIYFDRLYPGGVSGVDVTIWADTGEIREIVTMTSGLGYTPPSEEGGSKSGCNEGQADNGEIRGNDSAYSGANGGEEDHVEQAPTVPDNASESGTGLNITQIAIVALPISVAIALTTIKIHSKRKRNPAAGNIACQN